MKQGQIDLVSRQNFTTSYTKYVLDIQSNTLKVNLFHYKDEQADLNTAFNFKDYACARFLF